MNAYVHILSLVKRYVNPGRLRPPSAAAGAALPNGDTGRTKGAHIDDGGGAAVIVLVAARLHLNETASDVRFRNTILPPPPLLLFRLDPRSSFSGASTCTRSARRRRRRHVTAICA